mgnify:CR=1 FL=1
MSYRVGQWVVLRETYEDDSYKIGRIVRKSGPAYFILVPGTGSLVLCRSNGEIRRRASRPVYACGKRIDHIIFSALYRVWKDGVHQCE